VASTESDEGQLGGDHKGATVAAWAAENVQVVESRVLVGRAPWVFAESPERPR